MFEFFKRRRLANDPMVVASAICSENLACWQAASIVGLEENKEMNFWGGGMRNELYWRSTFKHYVQNFRQRHPKPQAPELESRVEGLQSVICDTSLTLAMRLGFYTDSELEALGQFCALTVALGIRDELLLDPKVSALIYEYLPVEWVQAAGLGRAEFERFYTQKTGEVYKPREQQGRPQT